MTNPSPDTVPSPFTQLAVAKICIHEAVAFVLQHDRVNGAASPIISGLLTVLGMVEEADKKGALGPMMFTPNDDADM